MGRRDTPEGDLAVMATLNGRHVAVSGFTDTDQAERFCRFAGLGVIRMFGKQGPAIAGPAVTLSEALEWREMAPEDWQVSEQRVADRAAQKAAQHQERVDRAREQAAERQRQADIAARAQELADEALAKELDEYRQQAERELAPSTATTPSAKISGKETVK